MQDITNTLYSVRNCWCKHFPGKYGKNSAIEPNRSTLTDLYRSILPFRWHSRYIIVPPFSLVGSSTGWIRLVFEAKYASEITVPKSHDGEPWNGPPLAGPSRLPARSVPLRGFSVTRARLPKRAAEKNKAGEHAGIVADTKRRSRKRSTMIMEEELVGALRAEQQRRFRTIARITGRDREEDERQHCYHRFNHRLCYLSFPSSRILPWQTFQECF